MDIYGVSKFSNQFTSSQDLPFCLLHGCANAYFCSPFSTITEVMICGIYYMIYVASYRDDGSKEISVPNYLSPQNQLDIYFLKVWEHWLGIAKSKNFFRSILNPSIKLIIVKFKNFAFNACTFFYLLMLSDKHNSRTARYTNLISSLISLITFERLETKQCNIW